jgi:crotonobetainyl-CoA:carnitine CoA-transferase CaiB-like acyl-CoA transferase
MSAAFEGIRIVDFTQVLAGPFATQQMATLGADVIKIEQREVGDTTRGLMANPSDGMSPSFLTCNIGKRSMTLDLKSPDAEEIVHRLVKGAHAVVENFKPGVMARLGFDYDTLRTIKPDLVYCSISGYGQSGPRSPLPAFDGAIQAGSGMMAISGHPETGPTRAGYFAVDMSTALHASFALSAALYRLQTTGQGQRIDVAMMDTALIMQAAQVSAYLARGTLPELLGNQSPTRQPTANVFQTADGHVQVIALKEDQVERLFTVLGISSTYAREPFCSANSRLTHNSEVYKVVNDALQLRPTDTWLDLFAEQSIPASAVNEYPALLADPQFDHRAVLADVSAPAVNKPTRTVLTGHTANEDGPKAQRNPPLLGEHTEEILKDLGYGAQEIEAFIRNGAV